MPRPAASKQKNWLSQALALAKRGEALTSPNPMVGAVVVRKGRVVGRGFHTYDGLRHAEVIALQEAGPAAHGSTLYINLEPCCHTGRTPPCTRAIIAAGVERVVAAMPDPNPKVAGRGFRQLRAAGIHVETQPGLEESHQLNEAFAKWIRTGLPFVTLKTALTLDGKTVLPQISGEKANRWITSPASRAEVQRMRHASDALLTGIGTVLADDPLLTDRTGLARRRPLLRVVVDSKLRLDPASRLVRSAHGDVLVFTCVKKSSPAAKLLRKAGVEIVHLERHISLRKVLAELGRRKILSVLLESGATLNRAALTADLVDKVRLFYAPIVSNDISSSDHASVQPATKIKKQLVWEDKNTKRKPAPMSAEGGITFPSPLSDARHELLRVQIGRFGPDLSVEGYLHDVYHL